MLFDAIVAATAMRLHAEAIFSFMDLQLPDEAIAWVIAWVVASLAHGLGGQVRAYL